MEHSAYAPTMNVLVSQHLYCHTTHFFIIFFQLQLTSNIILYYFQVYSLVVRYAGNL